MRTYILTALQKQAIPQFHDICLMNSCHLFTAVLGSIVKGKLCNPLGFNSCYNLQTFNHTLEINDSLHFTISFDTFEKVNTFT